MFPEYEIIVVGAGHAGCEAAAAAARMGSKTLLITMDLSRAGQMSCNPAMGGIAKGQIVREIDALGGISGIITDRTTIQFRMLNRSKGPAMWSPRAQNDRWQFSREWRLALEKLPALDFLQDMAIGITVNKGRVSAVKTAMGHEISCKTAILTNGTFLNGVIHVGEKNYGGGRAGEHAAKGLTECLISLGFESGRMKTGTPPRVDGRSLDYSKMTEQPGDENPGKFSFGDTKAPEKQLSCHLTYTTADTHDILETGFSRSPMYNGRILGTGPRYCPSIEDKITRFRDKDRHQIFVEPEGWETVEAYVNGFSTSLPEEVQHKALCTIPGFEKVKVFRPGYAIEYDYFPPTQLDITLETRTVKNLFFAGQINGTTGYEEAACQGLMAGINAHLKIREQEPFILKRSEAYIGVLLDDLVNKGTDEPYRMFTSRAEYRLLLRQDNADIRLTGYGHALGLAGEDRMRMTEKKINETEEILGVLRDFTVIPGDINPYLEQKGSTKILQKTKARSLAGRPQLSLQDLAGAVPALSASLSGYDTDSLEQAEILLKYAGYIEKEREVAEKMNRLEELRIDECLDYREITSLSSEAREKLSKARPRTLAQASRISGVSPADVSVLLVHIGR